MEDIKVIVNQLGSFGTNCYFVINMKTREAVIIDPADDPRFICNQLENRELHCAAILLTHGHVEHIGAVSGLKQSLGHATKVYACKEEEEVLSNPRLNLSSMFGDVMTLKADEWLKDGQTLELLDTKITCIAVPGHTKGGMCYYFEDEKLLFAGDTLFASSVGRSDFPTGDGVVLVESIREKLFTLPNDTQVYPGHNEKTSIGREKECNPYVGGM